MNVPKKTEPTAPLASKLLESVYLYEGNNKSGLIRLSGQHERLLVHGVISRLIPPKSPSATGKKRVLLVEIHRTPGYAGDAAKDNRYKARSEHGEVFRVEGQAKILPTAPPTPALVGGEPTRAAKQPDVEHKEEAIAANAPEGKKEKYPVTEKEIQRVARLLQIGDDPMVRMAYAAYHVGESPQNLYKKRREGLFPEGLKRGKGRSRFWQISVLDEYKAGRFQPKD